MISMRWNMYQRFHSKCLFPIKREKYESTFHCVFIVYEIALVNVLFCKYSIVVTTKATIGWNDGPAAVKCYFIWIMVAKEDRIRFAIKTFYLLWTDKVDGICRIDHIVVNKMLIHFNFSRKFQLTKYRAQGYR